MRPRPLPGRAAGLVVPLFSLHSARSWGIGEIGDLPIGARWLERAGFRVTRIELETFFFPHSYLNAALNEVTVGHWLMAGLRRVFPSQAGGLIVSAVKPPQEQDA